MRKPQRPVSGAVKPVPGVDCRCGTKGTKARYQVPAGFEGGQMPLHMRLPKLKGFKNPNKVSYQVVSVSALGRLFPDGGTVSIDDLVAVGAVRKNQPVRFSARETFPSQSMFPPMPSQKAHAPAECCGRLRGRGLSPRVCLQLSCSARHVADSRLAALSSSRLTPASTRRLPDNPSTSNRKLEAPPSALRICLGVPHARFAEEDPFSR